MNAKCLWLGGILGLLGAAFFAAGGARGFFRTSAKGSQVPQTGPAAAQTEILPDNGNAVGSESFDRADAPQLLQGTKKHLPPETFLKENIRWRPIRQLRMDARCGELLGLAPEDLSRIDEILSKVRTRAGSLIGGNSLVVTKPDGAQLAYIPPDEAAWDGVESEMRRGLREVLGRELNDYVLKRSKIDIELLTGNFGRLGRMIEIYPTPVEEGGGGETGTWTAFVYMGKVSGAPFSRYFEADQRDYLRKGDSANINWQDYYQFEEAPDFLSGLIQSKE